MMATKQSISRGYACCIGAEDDVEKVLEQEFGIPPAPRVYHEMEGGPIKTSRHTTFIPLDGRRLKETNSYVFQFIFDFYLDCLNKFAVLIFDHPRDLSGCGPMLYEGEENLKKRPFHDLAEWAIDVFNHHRAPMEDMQLQLVNLVKVNSFHVPGPRAMYYMTFRAANVIKGGQPSVYQAAVAYHGSTRALGLLRHVEKDRILAILDLQGVEEDVKEVGELFPGLKKWVDDPARAFSSQSAGSSSNCNN